MYRALFIFFTIALSSCVFETLPEKPQLKKTLPQVSNVVIADAGNEGNTSDLVLSFNLPEVESGISEFKLIIIRSSFADLINADLIDELGIDQLYSIPSGDYYKNIRLPVDFKDVFGNPIKSDSLYHGYILSISEQESLHQLSNVSNVFKYSDIAEEVITLDAVDVGNNNSAQDIRVTFTEPANNFTTSSYAIFFTYPGQNFTPAEISNAPNNRVKILNSGMGNYQIDLDSNFLTMNGDSFSEGAALEMKILSLPDSSAAKTGTFSKTINLSIENSPFIKTLTAPFKGNGGIIRANNSLLTITNLGTSIFNPNGRGLHIYNPELDSLYMADSLFEGGYGGTHYDYSPDDVYVTSITDQPAVYIFNTRTLQKTLHIQGFKNMRQPTDLCVCKTPLTPGAYFYLFDCNQIAKLRAPLPDYVYLVQWQYDAELVDCPTQVEQVTDRSCIIVNHKSNVLLRSDDLENYDNVHFFMAMPDPIQAISYSSNRNRLYAISVNGIIYEINYQTKSFQILSGEGELFRDGNAREVRMRKPAYLVVDDQKDRLYFTDRTEFMNEDQLVTLKMYGFKR